LLGFAYQLTAQLHCFPSREEAFCVDATEAPASDAATEMGPLVSLEQQNRVCGYLESGSSEGAKALAGGHKSSDKGYFVEPTVQVNTREDMKVVQEEIFGPVVVAMPFSDPAELVPSANDNVYGLAAGIWTRDISKPTAWPTKSLPEPSGSTAVTSSTLPFGGYKQSGWGAKWVTRSSTTTRRRKRCARESSRNDNLVCGARLFSHVPYLLRRGQTA
jgi:acyl-CoA reductase-like NAD-dependent aldehyde dehydrogenase